MKLQTLTIIRTDCKTPKDLLEVAGAAAWNFEPSGPIAQCLADLVALIEQDYIEPEPTLDDIAASEASDRRNAAHRDYRQALYEARQPQTN